MRRLWLLALVGVCLLGASGCAKKNTTGRQRVSGKVTLQSAPLDSGSIQFMPAEPGGQFGGGGVIANGEYAIPEAQGLPVGRYKVLISSGQPDAEVQEGELPGESGPPAEDRIPPEYNVNSEKFVDVSTDKENVFNFDIP